MKPNAFVLQNTGMNRDLSVSKAGESSAYENVNIRITATDKDTLLSVTNERGNKPVEGIEIDGTLVGSNVLNNHIILFTSNPDQVIAPNDLYPDSKIVREEGQEGESDTYIISPSGGLNVSVYEFSDRVAFVYLRGIPGDGELFAASFAPGVADTGYDNISVMRELFQNDDGSFNGILDLPEGTTSILVASSYNTDVVLEHKHVTDRIYRIDYDGSAFQMVRGDTTGTVGVDYETGKPLFAGRLNLDPEHPIESIVYHESDDVQKIYWVDGKNVLRFMNFMEKGSVVDGNFTLPWDGDNTYFDSNRSVKLGADVKITKTDSGEDRPNGVVQYLLTYFNKHGQETGYAWISDIVYLNPYGRGGAADETNTTEVILTFAEGTLDTSYSHFRIYSIFRSSRDSETVAYLVSEHATSEKEVIIIDNGAHLTLQDSSRLLYLGSQPVVASTITHKDQTLFLGDLQSVGKPDFSALEKVIRDNMFDLTDTDGEFIDGETWESNCITFAYSGTNDTCPDIPYVVDTGTYPYNNQLQLTSGEILSFKGKEKYRFALKLQLRDGTETDAIWIGDKENELYPVIDVNGAAIKRVIAKCQLPQPVIDFLNASSSGFSSVQLLIAEATAADRSVKAQGIINPTVFNVWERYNNRVYAMPSWISRPRNSGYANRHFEVIHNATESTGEIQCNYWETESTPNPYYQYKLTKQSGSTPESVDYYETFDGAPGYPLLMLVTRIKTWSSGIGTTHYEARCIVIEGFGDIQELSQQELDVSITNRDYSVVEHAGTKWYRRSVTSTSYYDWYSFTVSGKKLWSIGKARGIAYNKYVKKLISLGIPQRMIIREGTFRRWCNITEEERSSGLYFNAQLGDRHDSDLDDILNARDGSTPDANRWIYVANYNSVSSSGNYIPSFYKKHLMFVDENVVTLDSPELSYDSVFFDGAEYNFRIVGLAKMSSVISDYTISASHSYIPGALPDDEVFSGNISDGNSLNGIITWPLWKEYSLISKKDDGSFDQEDIKKRTSSDYKLGEAIVRYWLYMWQHPGSITEYKADSGYSILNSKVFANNHFAYSTIYLNEPFEFKDSTDTQTASTIGPIRMRVSEYLSSSMLAMQVGDEEKIYSGLVDFSLSVPGEHSYKLLNTATHLEDTTTSVTETDCFLYSSTPVNIQYLSDTHAIIPLPSVNANMWYKQIVLPYIENMEERLTYSSIDELPETITDYTLTKALIPWSQDIDADVYRVIKNDIDDLSTLITAFEYDEDNSTATFTVDLSDSTDWYEKMYELLLEDLEGNPNVYIRLAQSGYYYLIDINHNMHWEDATTLVYTDVDVLYRIPSGGSRLIRAEFATLDGDGASPWKFGVYNIGTGAFSESDDAFVKYDVIQSPLTPTPNSDAADTITEDSQYLFIGEVYEKYSATNPDTRYGGISSSAVAANRFIVAGPAYNLSDVTASTWLYANQGDTYFQRFDALRTRPFGSDATNQVIDITSVMLETHINLDGRTDLQRTLQRIASLDTTKFGQLNPAYSQQNNFTVRRDLDEDANTDVYRASLTWTLPKADLADVDEWSHITLASSLKLDADKGICRALRRVQNSIIAFQDKGISEILFNSRTQLSTQDGVPVEIANSGKVDGKRYLSNKYGCVNKWSIIEGKAALYFVDNINKAFCSFSGQGIDNISARLNFGTWFRSKNSLNVWNPKDFGNLIAHYDRIHSDVYLVSADSSLPTLVYNEVLGRFTSFYDYASVPMMVNVEDRFISFHEDSLWLQNEGLYCNFFNHQYGFSVMYRATPEPFRDKIWTNIEYRTDAYRVLDVDGNLTYAGEDMLDGGDKLNIKDGIYRENETFTDITVSNEYQTAPFGSAPKKRFRIWNYIIPRAQKTATNIHGLDRIRNPWVNVRLVKSIANGSEEARDLMQIHDVALKYFE